MIAEGDIGSTIFAWFIIIVIVLFVIGKVAENKAKGGGIAITQAAAKTQTPGAPPGPLLCPHCGGASFQAKRSAGAKWLLIPTVGVGALLAPKSRVKCVTCGTVFLRG